MAKYWVLLSAHQTVQVEASNGEEAIKKAHEDHDAYDWIIDDSEIEMTDDPDGVLPEHGCYNCEHYIADKKMCDYCKVENDKEPGWHCSLWDEKKIEY